MGCPPGVNPAGEELAESDPVLHQNDEPRDIRGEGEVVEEGDTKTIYQSPKARKAYLGNKSVDKIDNITADLKKLRKKL